MKARGRLFWHFLQLGYCAAAAWRAADRKKAFQRRRRYANG